MCKWDPQKLADRFPNLCNEGYYSWKGRMETIEVALTRENSEPKTVSHH